MAGTPRSDASLATRIARVEQALIDLGQIVVEVAHRHDLRDARGDLATPAIDVRFFEALGAMEHEQKIRDDVAEGDDRE